MKNILIALLVMVSFASAQNSTLALYSDVYNPKTLFAGTSMVSRSVTNAFDDTTQTVIVRGCAAVYLGIETSENDSVRLLVGYRMSKDGTNYVGGFTAIDSLTTVGTVGMVKYFALPQAALGAYSVRFRIYANSDILRYSADPTTKATFKIIRVPYNLQKVR